MRIRAYIENAKFSNNDLSNKTLESHNKNANEKISFLSCKCEKVGADVNVLKYSYIQ